MTESEERQSSGTPTLTEKSKVTFSVMRWVVGATIAICGSYYLVLVQLGEIRSAQREIQKDMNSRMDRIEKSFQEHGDADWVKVNQRLWAMEVRRLNGTNVLIPDVDSITRMSHP